MLTIEKANDFIPIIKAVGILAIMIIGFAIGWIATKKEDDQEAEDES